MEGVELTVFSLLCRIGGRARGTEWKLQAIRDDGTRRKIFSINFENVSPK
jgi:hypothetical protein